MDNALAAGSGEDEFVIESSQAPNLRVRKRQICYRESDQLSAKKKSKPRNRSKAAPAAKPGNGEVSKSKSNDPNPSQAISDEFIQLPDTQSLFAGIETSVDLFKNQEQLAALYVIQQNAMMQQEEEELDRLLHGLRGSYEVASKRVPKTPSSPEMVSVNGATYPRKGKENVSFTSKCTHPSTTIERPTCSNLTANSDAVAEQKRPVETQHQSKFEIQSEPLNLSTALPAKKASFAFPRPVAASTPRYPRVLQPFVQRFSNNVKQTERPKQISPLQQSVSSTVTSAQEVGIQANVRPRYRNAGIQNRTDNCFEITRYNTILLAREFRIDPEQLRKKMKRICNIPVLQQQPLWQKRSLNDVFTNNDPYYANLDFFIKDRSSRFSWE
ncbi:uncharacterized protein LOC126578954 [Anopheles aquasalis]|uniref:uncharacterized protein LOC126578954 n=1 Tax=Anopheles aquasalis TaxID=42839 RepID=UPI00215A2330|nr:uncharacterized protein LOC126578954 [Anopheles aquasalis]